jgi:hypothetical protein
MQNVVDFDIAEEQYRGLPNKIKFLREQVLGLTRPQFVGAMATDDPKLVISQETLRNMEKEGKGSATTRTRIHTTLNGLLTAKGYKPVDKTVLLAPLPLSPGVVSTPSELPKV